MAPTYNYECTKCGHEFEEFHKMTDPPVKKCPKCSGKVRKLISAGSGIIFKGSGFYTTDYKKKEASWGKPEVKKESHDCKNCPHKKDEK